MQVAKACLEIARDRWPVAIESYRNIRGLSEEDKG